MSDYWKHLEEIKVAKPMPEEVIGRKPKSSRALKYFLSGYDHSPDDYIVQTIPYSYVNISDRPVPENHEDVEINPWPGPQEIEFTWLELTDEQHAALTDDLVLSTDTLHFGILKPEIDFPRISENFLESWTLDVQRIVSIDDSERYYEDDGLKQVAMLFRYITIGYRGVDFHEMRQHLGPQIS